MRRERCLLGLAAALLAAGTLTIRAQEEVPAGGPFAGGARRPKGPGDGVPGVERPRPPADVRRGGEGMRLGEGGREMMLMRLLSSPRVSEELGITAEQSEALRAGMRKLQERQIDLQAQKEKLVLRQTEVVAGLMVNRDKGGEEALKLVDEIGALNTQMARLPVERILLVREQLTDEQILKAREMVRTRIEQYRTGGGEGARPPRREGAEGEGPRDGGERRIRHDGEHHGNREGKPEQPAAEPEAARF